MTNSEYTSKVELDLQLDKPRKFRFNFGTMRRIEALTGKNTLRNEFYRNINATDFMAIALAGLEKDDPTLTMEKLEELMTPEFVNKLTAAISESVRRAVIGPQSEEKNATVPPSPAAE